MNIQGAFNQVGGFWEHLRHPLEFQRGDLKINLQDQEGKLLLQSFFCGAVASLLASFIRVKPLTPASKAGFVLLATGVTGACYLLFALALKTQKLYIETHLKNQQLAEQLQKLTSVVKVDSLEKEEPIEPFEQVIKLCEEACDCSEKERPEKCEQMYRMIKDHQLDVNKVFEWRELKKATLLHVAIALENFANSQQIGIKLYQLGISAEYRDEEGNNYLHFLCKRIKNATSLTGIIIEKFPELVYERNHEGETPLHTVARYSQNGHYSYIIINSIKYGVDVNALDNNGNTPFDLACFYGHSSFLSTFADPKVDLEKSKEKGCLALRSILKDREKEAGMYSFVVDDLLKVSGWNLQTKQYLVHHACYIADEKLLKKILQKWAVDDPSKNDFLNEKSLNDFRWAGAEPIDPIDTLLRKNDRPDARQRMLISLMKYMNPSKKEEHNLAKRALLKGYHLLVNAILPLGFGFSKAERQVYERSFLKRIKEEDHGGFIAGLIYCFKMIYQEGDQFGEDLQDIYDQNIK